MRAPSTKSACLIEKDCLKTLFETADIDLLKEYLTRHKPMEFVIEYYLEKPLKECSLEEIIDVLVINYRTSNWFETVDYTDDSGHCTLKITQRLGLNTSKLINMANESVLKTYGVKSESIISERTIFMKIFKNQ